MAKTGKKRGAGAAAGGSGAVDLGGRCAVCGARPVDLSASGAVNFPEK